MRAASTSGIDRLAVDERADGRDCNSVCRTLRGNRRRHTPMLLLLLLLLQAL